MPIYEYECGSCHHRFELRQGFHDEPRAACPQCQKKARRVFHPAPIIFKGSGFYVTDHRNNTNPASEKTETKKSPEPASDKKETKSSS